ncbi:hypothetical protein [Rubellicoccus peritrichatus]|uniref:Uncharacterized protein n=1 Tax=Rubellicoccus peritrichatus TaxID=3080537 RepID=A0AAQ3L8R7_9BACT|nr:hypothetical protein [Puniceicoccus sp. CR14]WOO40737.1 hypothetical protein RZN69_19110 [Puniceicoccus sp. CR14]
MYKKLILLAAAFVLASNVSIQARALDWGSSVNAQGFQQDGVTPLNDAFVFYLGVFANGFTPTNANVDDWAANWTTVDAVNYNPAYKVFNARHTTSATDPAAGTQGYIWGIRRDKALNEWILITDSTWLWPENSLFGLKETWTVRMASEAIVGSINDSNYQMMTQNVGDAPLPSIDYAIWAKRFFADGDPNADSEADPDSNGLANMAEFALDGDPVGQGRESNIESGVFEVVEPLQPQESEGQRYLAVIVKPSVDASVNISGTLATDPGFSENVEAAVVEQLEDGSLMVRDPTPVDDMTQQKFLRVQFD